MNNKKILIIFLGLLILLCSASSVYGDHDYHIEEAFLNLTVQDNGMLHVEETYNYIFIGTFNGITRDIPLKTNESVENLNVTVEGGYAECVKSVEDEYMKLKIYLYSDKAHTQKIHDTRVKVHINYNIPNLITVYKDTVSLQYKIWGEEWETDVGKLTTIINLPGSTGNMYWLNPSQYNLSSSMNGNTITSISTKIPGGEFYELQLLMPTSDFKNATYAKHSDINAKDKIIQIQDNYKNMENLYNTLYLILGVLFIVSPIIPLGIYLKHGREPKINYRGIYEREPPTKDPAAKVNALIQEHASDKPGLKGFEATIMDLINRTVINIEASDKKELILHINTEKIEQVDRQEKHLIQLLNRFAYNNTLNLQEFENQLHIEHNARYFKDQYEAWRGICKTEYLLNIKEYFNNKGKTLSNYFGVVGLILSILVGFMTFGSGLPNARIGFIGCVMLFIISLICLFLPNDIFGQCTKEGKEYNEKWKNFKKFLKDNSLLNEHPPESIVIWNQYLVYATALGVADNVYEAMQMHVPRDSYYDNNLFLFYHYNGMWMMHNAINTGFSTVSGNSGSGLGGVGGGSGGGGGGAF